MKKVKFYKTSEGLWFIDLPAYIEQGGHISHLQMVAGADVLLDILSDQGSTIYLNIKGESFEQKLTSFHNHEIYEERLIKCKEPINLGMGCNYRLSIVSPHFDKFVKLYKDEIWLCPATLFVFDGIYPDQIWFEKITKDEYETEDHSFEKDKRSN